MNQNIIPSIHNMKQFEKFLETDIKVCFLLDFHLNFLPQMIERAHKSNKIVFVHQDMIKGLANDEQGTEFLCQTLKVDGIISTKIKILETAHRNKKMTIMRIFAIDSKSLAHGIHLFNQNSFDYAEILPAAIFTKISTIADSINKPLIGGGLIESMDDINKCLDANMIAVSTSNIELWLNR